MPAVIRKRALKSGKISWQVDVEGVDPATGQPRRVYRSFETRKAARAFVENRRAAARKGDVVDPSREPLGDYVAFWLDTVAEGHVRAVTLSSYRYLAARYVVPYIGGLPIADIDLDVIAAWQATLRDAKLSKRTRQLALGVVRQALDFAVSGRRLPFNPAALHRFGKHETAPPTKARNGGRRAGAVVIPEAPKAAARHNAARKAMPLDAVRAFLAAAKGNPHEALFNALFFLGLRPSEALALRWRDVKRSAVRVEQGVRYVAGGAWEFTPTKTGDVREVPVPDVLQPMLRTQKAAVGRMRLAAGPLWQDLGLVFPHPEGKPLRWDVIRRCHWRAIMKRAGLGTVEVLNATTGRSRFRPSHAPYCTRHTFVSVAAWAGVNVKVAAAVVGHRDTQTTLRWYTHSASDLESQAVDAVAALISGGAEGGAEGGTGHEGGKRAAQDANTAPDDGAAGNVSD